MKADLKFVVVGGEAYDSRMEADREAKKKGSTVILAAVCPFCSEINLSWDCNGYLDWPSQYHNDCWRACQVGGSHVQVDESHGQGLCWSYVKKHSFPERIHSILLGARLGECRGFDCSEDGNFYRW